MLKEIVRSRFNVVHFVIFLILDGVALFIIHWINIFATLEMYGANGVILNHWAAVIGSNLLLFTLIYVSYRGRALDKAKNYAILFLLNWLGIIFEWEIMGFMDDLGLTLIG